MRIVRADDEGALAAAEVLRGGGVVVVPTDTVYGLAARPADADAVRALFGAKGRPEGMHLPVLAASVEQVRALGVAFTELLKTRETQAAAPAEPAAPRPEGGSKPSEAPAELPDLVTLDPAAVAAKAKGRIKPASKREVPRGKLDEHASIELTKNPSLTYEQLATMLGCKPGTLRDKRKCPLLAAAKTRNKATKQEFYGKDKWTDRRPDDD